MKMWQIKQMQSLDLVIKIKKSKMRIKEWLNYWDNMTYVSFSGGKDSTVLLDLVRSVNKNIPIVFCDTGIEFPEVRKFVYSFIKSKKEKHVIKKYGYQQEYYTKDKVVILRPKYNFKDIINKYGYPVVSKEQAQYIEIYQNTKSKYMKNRVLYGNQNNNYKISKRWRYLINAPFKISDRCCEIMKIRPFIRYEKETQRKGFVGTLVEESNLRLNSFIKNKGCNAFYANRPISRPLSFWTEQDILKYLKYKDLKYASVYGDIINTKDSKLKTTGRSRTGCIYCAFGVHLDSMPNRFQILKKTHPKLYKYCLNNLEMDRILDYIDIPYK